MLTCAVDGERFTISTPRVGFSAISSRGAAVFAEGAIEVGRLLPMVTGVAFGGSGVAGGTGSCAAEARGLRLISTGKGCVPALRLADIAPGSYPSNSVRISWTPACNATLKFDDPLGSPSTKTL